MPGTAIEGKIEGDYHLTDLNFSSAWRKDYQLLIDWRNRLYRQFFLFRIFKTPLFLLQNILRVLTGSYRLKMEMFPRRKFRTFLSERRAAPLFSSIAQPKSDLSPITDDKKRTFLKVAGVAGAGLIASQLVPKKADALILGSTPSSSVVGVKDAGNTRINPAKEDGNLATIKTNTDTLTASGAGGYIRQDSTATIAKETGGNLATLAAKDFATQATLQTVAKDVTIQDLYNQLSLVLDKLEFGAITDKSKTLLVQLDPKLTSTTAVATVATVTTVSNMTNQVRIGDVQAQRVVEAQLDTAFNIGIVNHVTF
jgi:hypothetical protein